MSTGIEVPFYQVDAFTDTPFGGNPAAVCLLEAPLPASTMQLVAAEMNLSETAFVEPPGAGGVRKLRWFTPTVEVPLCGHATLATAHVLLHERREPGPLRFETLSGILVVHDEVGGWLRMDLPEDPPHPVPPPPGLLEALGCPPGSLTFEAVKVWLVRVGDEGIVRGLAPDMARLRAVDLGPTALGVSVTAPGSGEVDFVSRFFGPWVGVDEDPVTGVAHTVLAPYWVKEMETAALRAAQVSPRGGELRVRMVGDRVHLSGQAVTVVRGSLSLASG